MEKFRKSQLLFLFQGDYRPIFARSKVVLNQTAFSEVNFRCFEAPPYGCAVLTERCGNGFEELFDPGVNILSPFTRNDYHEAAKTAAEWLAKPDKLAELAEAGAKHIAQNHSSDARALHLLELSKGLGKIKSPSQHYHVRTAFGMIAAELNAPQLAAHREFYRKLANG